VDRVVTFLASGAYVGYAPVAPGTFGSLLAVVVAAAMPICGRAGRLFGQADSPRIVLDEVCGMLMAGALLPATAWTLGLAFVAFRVFDVVKPFPAGYFDHRVKNGFGVVADDLVAGIYAHLVVRVLS